MPLPTSPARALPPPPRVLDPPTSLNWTRVVGHASRSTASPSARSSATEYVEQLLSLYLQCHTGMGRGNTWGGREGVYGREAVFFRRGTSPPPQGPHNQMFKVQQRGHTEWTGDQGGWWVAQQRGGGQSRGGVWGSIL